MSRPRAATSVATRTRISPDLNPSSARVRSGWDRSEWIATASMPFAIEPAGQPAGGELGPGEHEDLAEVLLADQVGEEGLLAVPIDRVDQLADRLRRGVAGATSTVAGSCRIEPRQVPDLLRERRREQQVLAARREQLEDPPDVRQEAHVQHPVRLVEHEDLDLAEIDRPLPDVVEQPARRRDEDLDAGAQRLDLGLDRDAAVDHGRAKRDRPPVGPDAPAAALAFSTAAGVGFGATGPAGAAGGAAGCGAGC